MQETNKDLIVLAARCLAPIGDDAIPSIARLLASPQRETRYDAIHEFRGQLDSGTCTNREALNELVPALAQCINDPDPCVTKDALRALATINSRSQTATAAVREALKSTNPMVREEAAEAAKKLGL